MAKRNIVWTKTADVQFFGVLDYWVKRNKSATYSKKLLKLVTKRAQEIAENPFIYKNTNFKDVKVASLRNFSIYFKVEDNQIIINSFWDNRQNPEKLLKILQSKI